MTHQDCKKLASSSSHNAITVVENFVALADCGRMLEETVCGEWVGSAVAGTRDGFGIRSRERRSASLLIPVYSEWAQAWLRKIERHLAAILAIESRNLEPWQMTRYRRGDAYDYHVDCGNWEGDPSGERRRTVLIVLEQPSRGGATHFRALRQTVPAIAGRLIVWCNLLPTGRCNHAMIHSGRPVWQGRKTILTTWERQRPYVEQTKGESHGDEQG